MNRIDPNGMEDEENRFSLRNIVRSLFGLSNDNNNTQNNDSKVPENTQLALEATNQVNETINDVGQAVFETTAETTDKVLSNPATSPKLTATGVLTGQPGFLHAASAVSVRNSVYYKRFNV